MTKTQKAAMQQALDAIDWLRHHLTEHHACLHMSPQNSGIPALVDKTEAALRAALTEPKRKRRTVKESLTDDGWKRTREYCS